ncbi:hypothetical protein A8B75_10995 [Sphingomonadales bacterium EhC05]|mgnify:CR=1 FL=1|jgi:hypothetical protein|uniref:hypothetical protein n=1 Tax=Parasphingorhabdus sp. TaxID=2709688 RepID=UPI0007F47671|nr:hypothetical protein A8B75_10995 [Sphingomonadales bacterium EhC05]
MTIETDKQALERAYSQDQDDQKFWSLGEQRLMLHKLQAEFDIQDKPADPVPHSIFFSYMRFNTDNTFYSKHYYYKGGTDPIPPGQSAADRGSLKYFIKDMATYARTGSSPDGHQYEDAGEHLENIKFPQRFCYCAFFMDDLYWKFLMDEETPPKPTVIFHKKKRGKAYSKHPHAFGPPSRVITLMPNRRTGLADEREAVVMINRMHGANGKKLPINVTESFAFDFWMRVKYAGNTTSGATLIIDPGGDNTGPPGPPPDLP